jgi:hypothetical protein
MGGFYLHRISSLRHVVVRLRFIGIIYNPCSYMFGISHLNSE